MTPILFGKRVPVADNTQYVGTTTEVEPVKGPSQS